MTRQIIFKQISLAVFLLLLLLSQMASSQKITKDTALQIETFENLATVGTGIIFQDFKLTIQGEKSNIEYQPNQQLLLSFDGSYKYIGGGFTIGLLGSKDNAFEDKITYYDFRTNFYFRRWLLATDVQFFRGFSISDPPKNVSLASVQNMKPNLFLLNGGLSFYYAINPKYSFEAIYQLSERLLKSRGSLALGTTQFYQYLNSSSSFYPEEFLSRIMVYKSWGHFFTMTIDAGYQYTFVWRKWYLAPFAVAGIGAQYQNYLYKNTLKQKDVKPAYNLSASLPLGYNGDRIYGGFQASYNKHIIKVNEADMRLQMWSLRLFVGWRFLYHTPFGWKFLPDL